MLLLDLLLLEGMLALNESVTERIELIGRLIEWGRAVLVPCDCDVVWDGVITFIWRRQFEFDGRPYTLNISAPGLPKDFRAIR